MSEMFSQLSGTGVQGLATVLLVDGENIPQALAGQIITKTAPTGRPIVQRVYGDVTRLPNWEAAPGFEMIHTGRAKNGADMRICIDAMDLVYRGGVGRVVLASSDRDFTHLAQNLRGKGIDVIGMGEAKTHESFRKACSRFVELGTDKPCAAVVAPRVENQPIAQSPPVKHSDPFLAAETQIKAFVSTGGKAGILITDLSVKLRMAHGFLISQQAEKTWREYLSARPALYDLDPKGASARVRLK